VYWFRRSCAKGYSPGEPVDVRPTDTADLACASFPLHSKSGLSSQPSSCTGSPDFQTKRRQSLPSTCRRGVTRNSGAAASLLRYSFVTVSTATLRVLWLSSNPFDQSQNDQQNNRADEGVDDRANGATAG
jgi:hypothetical protein